MIPYFPHFRPLGLDVRAAYCQYTARFPCYSEFNFIDLYAWDLEDAVEICMLNDNLVVKRADYLSRKASLSFIGENQVQATIETLLDFAEKLTGTPVLQSVPEMGIQQDGMQHLRIEEERHNADYILDVAAQINLPGSQYSDRRTKLRRFIRNYGDVATHRLLDPTSPQTQVLIWELFERWAQRHCKQAEDITDERAAMQKLLDKCAGFNLQIMGVFDRKKLIAFTINEILPNGYALGHFHKADHDYKGVFDYTVTTSSQYAKEAGCSYMNIEMDLGIDTLRQAKRQLCPIAFLKKLTVARAA